MEKIDVSKQMSYWLRHEPEDLEMDCQGFVAVEELVEKLRERFPDIDRGFVEDLASEGKRYEVEEGKIRAVYGHTVDLDLDLPEDKKVKELFYGTTSKTAYSILMKGLEPKERNMVHLSATEDNARKVGMRRTEDPTVLKVDVEGAREDGIRFFKATENIYLSREIPKEHIEKCDDL